MPPEFHAAAPVVSDIILADGRYRFEVTYPCPAPSSACPMRTRLWLDRKARRRNSVPMTELVRRAVREYRERYHTGGPRPSCRSCSGRTRGCWAHGDGLRYQDAARDEWELPRVRWLLDSVILIDHFNGIDSATRFIDEESMDIALSPVTRAEVLTGFTDAHLPLATELLDQFPTLAITARGSRSRGQAPPLGRLAAPRCAAGCRRPAQHARSRYAEHEGLPARTVRIRHSAIHDRIRGVTTCPDRLSVAIKPMDSRLRGNDEESHRAYCLSFPRRRENPLA